MIDVLGAQTAVSGVIMPDMIDGIRMSLYSCCQGRLEQAVAPFRSHFTTNLLLPAQPWQGSCSFVWPPTRPFSLYDLR